MRLRTWNASSTCSGFTVSGGARRSDVLPALRTRSPCSRAASTTSAAARSSSIPTRRPRPRTPTTPVRDAARAADRAPEPRNPREELFVDRFDDGAGRGAGDRVGTERRSVVARHERAGGGVGDEEGADREAVCEALREGHEIGAYVELLEGEERARAAHTGLHLVAAEQRGQRATPPPRSRRRAGRLHPPRGSARAGRARPRRRQRPRARARRSAARSAHRRGAARTALACRAARSRRGRRASCRGSLPRARRPRAFRSPCVRT